MRVFSYIVNSDSGFAPNPFYGSLTLACCKPVIRRTAEVGDWVVGLSNGSARVVFAMLVSEKITFAEYWNDRRFVKKRRGAESRKQRSGDNIYEPLGDGGFHQQKSRHSLSDGSENPKHKKKDLGGKYVLVAKRFVYFGAGSPKRPQRLEFLKVGRGHRSRFKAPQVAAFAAWFDEQPRGVQGKPAEWSTDDPNC